MRRFNFTFLEAMVIVTIIAIMAGVLIPSIQQAKLRAIHKRWMEETGIKCELKDFKEAFVEVDSNNKITVNQSLLPNKVKYETDSEILFKSWKDLTGNPKMFTIKEFEALVEDEAVDEFSFPFYVKITGNPKNLTEFQFNCLKRHKLIDFPSVWSQYKSLPKLEKE